MAILSLLSFLVMSWPFRLMINFRLGARFALEHVRGLV